MIDQTTLEKLLLNIHKIEKLANIHGFKNISIFKPLFFTDSDKLHFFAEIDPGRKSSFFQLTELASELSFLLNCPVLFFSENRVAARSQEYEKYIKNNKILLTPENQREIINFFSDLIEVKETKIVYQSGEYEYTDDIILSNTSGLLETGQQDNVQD